jgi:hypothetical protein
MSGATTRRTFLASAASIPVVGVATASGISSDRVVAEVSPYGEGLIAECQRQDYDLSVDGGSIIEMLYGQNEDRIGDSEFLEDVTDAQADDLGKMVSEAISSWARKHKIDTTAWAFGKVRNQLRFGESEIK